MVLAWISQDYIIYRFCTVFCHFGARIAKIIFGWYMIADFRQNPVLIFRIFTLAIIRLPSPKPSYYFERFRSYSYLDWWKLLILTSWPHRQMLDIWLAAAAVIAQKAFGYGQGPSRRLDGLGHGFFHDLFDHFRMFLRWSLLYLR